ncbi:MAG: hypothetical protein FJ358_07015 [Thaumarchaeota archaeon]|nr:hypothetical protein [Nitrososphaerota archaeon]
MKRKEIDEDFWQGYQALSKAAYARGGQALEAISILLSGSLIVATLPLLVERKDIVGMKTVFDIPFLSAVLVVALIPVVIAAILYRTTEIVNTVA